jgi:hypothetical protein
MFAQTLLDRRDDEACRAFDVAEIHGADPDRCAAGRWMAHMLNGDFAAAWKESDEIRRRGAPDPHRMWDGEPLAGRRVIVRCLHGLGDSLQFLRYADSIRNIASDLTVEVPPAMVELASCINSVGRVVTWQNESDRFSIAWTSQVEVTELPYLFRTHIRELPIARRYLKLPREGRSRMARIMGNSRLPRVGVVWAAGDWNLSRSVPFLLFQNLLSEPCCEYWNLQGGSAHDEWKRLESRPQCRDIAEIGDGLMNLARTIHEMDLVITVDTLAAHMAGAMGIPAWVLLQHAADWRWMTRGNSSPWYPSLRLFRQRSPNNWKTLIDYVRQELQTWLQQMLTTRRVA